MIRPMQGLSELILPGQYRNEHWSALIALALLRGDDLSGSIPLIWMPANNLFTELEYSWGGKKWTKNGIKVNGKLVARQNHYEPGQDFVPPPDGYFLLGAGFTTSRKLGRNDLDISFSASNLLNTVYRDYLNRLRYFADEPGINFNIGLRYSF